jgi:dihydropteroate synthase
MSATLDEILMSHRTGRTVLMGILNVTPDSFSDGGQFFHADAAVAQARRMVEQGADIIDIGAESTRPGSQPVAAAEQIARVERILPAVKELGALVSIDTTSAEVARFALANGAAIINDISAGRDDPAMLPLAAERGAPIVLMHMLGRPRTMQNNPQYKDVVAEVREFLSLRVRAAAAAGVQCERCIIDPGIGFGKLLEHNLALIAGVGRLAELGCPVLVGPSRKRFLGELTGRSESADRAAGTVAGCLAAWHRGASVFRVHDVAAVADAFAVAGAISRMKISP